jgi:hypothetical protein
MRWGRHTPPAVRLRDRRACAIPSRSVPLATKTGGAVPIIGDSEPRALTNRANAQTEYLAAPSLKRRGRIKTSRNQLATQGEHGSITACDDALSLAAVRANERGTDRSLRKLLLAINF